MVVSMIFFKMPNKTLNQTRRTEAALFPKFPAAGWLALRYATIL
jgi:hypothetical protein